MSNLEQMTDPIDAYGNLESLLWTKIALDRFEKINLRIFLASYDKDQGTTLTALEKERQRV